MSKAGTTGKASKPRAPRGVTDPSESDLRLQELQTMADETFVSHEMAKLWLHKPHPMLDGFTPLEIAKSSHGVQRAKDILLAIKYGGVD